MEKQEISSANVDWVDLIRHVAREQVSVELADGPIAIAEVVPKRKPISIKDFGARMASFPSLGDDVDAFAKDIEENRKGYKDARDPWES